MTERAYPAARAVVSKVQERLALHVEAARSRGDVPSVPLPDAATIEAAIDAAFWASLRREEDYTPTISLSLLPPEGAPHPLMFERPLPVSPTTLARLAPAVERPGIHLGIWPAGDQLILWGTTRTIPMLCLVVEVVAPGLLVVKHPRSDAAGKFVNVAVLEANQIKVVDERAASSPEGPPLLTELLSSAPFDGSVNTLVDIAVSMRGHGRGGSLLVVPEPGGTWRESVVLPVRYSVSPPYRELADLLGADPDDRRQRQWQDALSRALHAVAGLTAVDGATVITNRFELLAFGVTIVRRHARPQVEQVVVTEPIEGNVAEVIHPSQLGGTRHLSAAQFIQDQRDSFALVASQDGRFTLFACSPSEGMVHAHRVEALLL